jgi:hypothetical protein
MNLTPEVTCVQMTALLKAGRLKLDPLFGEICLTLGESHPTTQVADALPSAAPARLHLWN